jgi:hypothetical protein
MKKTKNTTIQISSATKKALDSLKEYRRETYNDLIMRVLEEAGKGRKETGKPKKNEAQTHEEKAEKRGPDAPAELEY